MPEVLNGDPEVDFFPGADVTLEAFVVLIHEVRTRLDHTPVRSSVFSAIVGEVRVAQFVAEHAQHFDEIRTGLNRALLELALRNVLDRKELAHAHDAAQRALKVVVSTADERKITLPPPAGGRAVTFSETDVGLALIHARDAATLMRESYDDPSANYDAVLAKIDGIATILQRVHDEYAA